jgi:hypothetical protein
MNKAKWTSVPEQLAARWAESFAVPSDGSQVAGNCPVCGAEGLHRYYCTGQPIDAHHWQGRYIAKGALWEWCSSCRTFEHASALVPSWWRSDISIAAELLTATPDALEDAVEANHEAASG